MAAGDARSSTASGSTACACDWLTRIEIWEPGRRFVDTQVRGPYRLWRHTHVFEDHPEGTLVRDRVSYEIPLGPLGELARLLFVRRDLDSHLRPPPAGGGRGARG